MMLKVNERKTHCEATLQGSVKRIQLGLHKRLFNGQQCALHAVVDVTDLFQRADLRSEAVGPLMHLQVDGTCQVCCPSTKWTTEQ